MTPWTQGVKESLLAVHAQKKTAALMTHGLLPHESYTDAMRNFQDSPLNPTRPDRAAQKANPNALKDWNRDTNMQSSRMFVTAPFQRRTRNS